MSVMSLIHSLMIDRWAPATAAATANGCAPILGLCAWQRRGPMAALWGAWGGVIVVGVIGWQDSLF